MQILNDLKEGKVTINDLLGSLYNKGESPDIKIPPGVSTHASQISGVACLRVSWSNNSPAMHAHQHHATTADRTRRALISPFRPNSFPALRVSAGVG